MAANWHASRVQILHVVPNHVAAARVLVDDVWRKHVHMKMALPKKFKSFV
jgi:hypothetical protein